MGKSYTQEESEILNDPEFIYVCKKCGVPKPNKEYSKDNSAGGGRRYVTHCKDCRNDFTKRQYTLERKREIAKVQRTKNRFTMLLHSSKGNAKKRGIEHSLSLDDIKELFANQGGLCYYTQRPMFSDLTGIGSSEDSISLDRVDSNKGYTKDNVVMCRWIVNKIKNDLSVDKLLEIVRQIESNGNIKTSSISC